MISLPPSEHDLHAYVDGHLSDEQRRQLQNWLASHPEQARQVAAWQADAQHLRAALGSRPIAENPHLDPALIRQRVRARTHRRLAMAAAFTLAMGTGALGGWQARGLGTVAVQPMGDAMQAYRLFALEGVLPADLKTRQAGDMQQWLDHYFTGAARLPDLHSAGFQAVGGRLLSTEQGPAAMVLYEDGQGRRISFYIRTPGPKHFLLPPGARQDGGLNAEYWSGGEYNYALVSRVDDQAVQVVRRVLGRSI